MQKRVMGATGVEVSPLGFGIMRMPTLAGEFYDDGVTQKIDVEQAIDLIRFAIDSGVNYLDTAYNYHGGHSEEVVGAALADGYRQRVLLASKSPAWLYKQPEDFDRFLSTQLKRLNTDCLDFYMIHSLNGGSWKRTQRINAIDSLLAAKADGRVRHIGFSFHDDLDLFKEILDAAPWDFCQIQLNYKDTEYQAGLEGMRLAAQRGMGVVVMEPLRGGRLAEPPERVRQVFVESGSARTPVEWGLDYLWDLPEVSVVLSGMGSHEMVAQNCEYAARSRAGMLSEEERSVLARAKQALESYATVPCTGCNYCVEYCPNKIAIPYNIRAWNMKETDGMDAAVEYYNEEVQGFGRNAEGCTGCGTCEEHCPQHIEISAVLPQIHEELAR